MALAPATGLGPYEILAPLGAGGMGEVYRARNARLDRTVAIKILPAQFCSDPVHKQRFEREAKTISHLNHPHICVLYDVGHQDGIDYFTRFPGGSGRWQVSQNGGAFPVWRADSREIYFFSPAPPVQLLAAEVSTKGEEFQAENVRPLFPGSSVASAGQLFDVTPDGKRFLLSLPPNVGSPPLTLVLNWTAELRKK